MAVETTFTDDAFDMFQIDRHAMDFHKPLQPTGDVDEPVVVNARHVACPQYAGKIVSSGKVLAPRGIAEADIWPVIDKFTFGGFGFRAVRLEGGRGSAERWLDEGSKWKGATLAPLGRLLKRKTVTPEWERQRLAAAPA